MEWCMPGDFELRLITFLNGNKGSDQRENCEQLGVK